MSAGRTRTLRPDVLFGLAAGAGGVLLLIVGIELITVGGTAAPAQGLTPAAATTTGTPVDGSASLPPGVVEASQRVILARPLFSPQRRPPSVAVAGPMEPRLSAIIVAPAGRRAIFAGDGGARGTVVGVGQQAGAFHVLSIDDHQVRVSGPEGIRTLHPARDAGGNADGSGGGGGGDLPPHPSILDLLRARNALPAPQNGAPQIPQQTAPAAPE